MNIGIIGNGSWATALAKLLVANSNTVHWWMRDANAVEHLLRKNHNLQYLTSVYFPKENIYPTCKISDIFVNCNLILIAVPSAYIKDVIQELPVAIFRDKKIISAIKGVLPSNYQLLNDYLADKFELKHQNYFSISGPCHAEEVAQEKLSYLTFSGLNLSTANEIAGLFKTNYLRTTVNTDLWGSQYAAVLKNIYALGAGIAHGIGYGDNFMSVYITNAYREMYGFLLYQYQITKHTEEIIPDFHTSAYLGDLLVTCYSLHSRNRTFGALIGKGYSIQAAIAEMNMVAEGLHALKGMQEITRQMSITLPILQLIAQALEKNNNTKEMYKKMENILS